MAKPWMDFARIRAQSDFATILAHYHIAHAPQQNQILVLCPFHDDQQPSLSVNLERKLFHCFACRAKGDILDFIALIENVSLSVAALNIIQCCGILVGGQSPHQSPMATKNCHKQTSGQNSIRKDLRLGDESVPCSMLTLDSTHRYLFDRGLTPELIEIFGLGYCSQGA